MQHYDYIIAGGGCAGTSLAYQLLQNKLLADKRLLIIDENKTSKRERTWSFWSKDGFILEHLISHKWSEIEFITEKKHDFHHLAPYKYCHISGHDFHNYMERTLGDCVNIDFFTGTLEDITEIPNNKVVVTTNGTKFTSDWVFNSCFNPKKLIKNTEKHHYLLQHFKGWFIETEKPFFNEKAVRFIDFRTKQHNDTRFFYILPFSPTKALVEYTIFSQDLIDEATYDALLVDYVEDMLGIENYTITDTEFGVIPMTDHAFEKKSSQRVINIGTNGGVVRPSTGYAFMRIQRESEAIAKNLLKHGHPNYGALTPARYKFYDSLLLNIMQGRGNLVKPIFTQLFYYNKAVNVLKFLNEETNILQDMRIMVSCPWTPFFQSIYNIYVKRQIA